jgi:hypothetical protein
MSIYSNPPDSTQEETQAYIRALDELLGDQDPLAVLEATPAILESSFVDVTPELASTPEAAGKWSMKQVAQHLADSELVLGFRMRLVLAQDRPTLSGYDQEAWAERLRYDQVELADALGQFRVLREANLALIRRTPTAALDRAGVHGERGEESVRRMLQLYAAHDLVHRRQLERVRASVSDR